MKFYFAWNRDWMGKKEQKKSEDSYLNEGRNQGVKLRNKVKRQGIREHTNIF